MLRLVKSAIRSNKSLYQTLVPIWARIRGPGPDGPQEFPWETERFQAYCEAVGKRVENPFFVKVGANDGVSGDPCCHIFLENNAWHGILVEPVPYVFALLKENFSDSDRFTLKQLAVGSGPIGEATFYYIDKSATEHMPDLPSWYDRIGSFDRTHITNHLPDVGPYIIEAKVQTMPLVTLLEQEAVKDIHVLHIDTEGFDYEVLKSIDLAKNKPLCIFVEHSNVDKETRQAMASLLKSNGYRVRDCGRDYFAVNREFDRRLG